MPTRAPTPAPVQAPCWVGFSVLVDADLAVLVLADHRRVEGPDRARGVQVEHRLVVGLGVGDVVVDRGVEEHRSVGHSASLIVVVCPTPCSPRPRAAIAKPLMMNPIPTSSASVVKPMSGLAMIAMPAISSTIPARACHPRFSYSANAVAKRITPTAISQIPISSATAATPPIG